MCIYIILFPLFKQILSPLRVRNLLILMQIYYLISCSILYQCRMECCCVANDKDETHGAKYEEYV